MIVDRERVEKALPGYTVGERLGSGAFGLVLAGEHRRMGRPVAIKVMDADGHDGVSGGFAAEARMLAALDHPHVVRVHDYVEAEGLCLVVMELLTGGTLTRRRVGMGPEEACAVGVTVAAALKHAHGHGVLHRDIKPDNILFTGNGTLKVGDFGIAKMFAGSAATASRLVGTPLYMAPEQIQSGRLSPQTDLYALGIVLYGLLAGRPPFDPKQPLRTLWNQHLTEPPPPLENVAPPVAAVVLRALAKSPADRHADAGAFARDLAAAATQAFGSRWKAPEGWPAPLDELASAESDHSESDHSESDHSATTPSVGGGAGVTTLPATTPEISQHWDFFISYADANRAWAEWIAWELEAAGYRVLVQASDSGPRSRWTSGMAAGVEHATRTVAVLSQEYVDSVSGQAEWKAVFHAGPREVADTLIPVRVDDCPPPGLLGELATVDLFDRTADIARRFLLDRATVALAGGADNSTAPAFPTSPPPSSPANGSATLVPPQRSSVTVAPAFPGQRPPPPAAAVPAPQRHSVAAEPLLADLTVVPPPDQPPAGFGASAGKARRTAARGALICAAAVLVLAAAVGIFDPGILSGGNHPAPKSAVGLTATVPPTATTTTATTTSAKPRTRIATGAAGASGPARPTDSPTTAGPPAPISTSAVTPQRLASTAKQPSNPGQPGPAGPGNDANYRAGSEVTVAGCAGWMDFSGRLYGTLSAGAASCAAEVTTVDDAYGTAPSTVSLTVANYNETNSNQGAFFYAGYYKFSVKICVWNQSAAGDKVCSPTYTDTQGTVAQG